MTHSLRWHRRDLAITLAALLLLLAWDASGADLWLERFYGGFGFVRVGDPYPEDNIPHLEMLMPGAPTP